MTRPPRNTTADAAANPLSVLAASSGPGGFAQAIEEQERSGQAQLVASTVLPTAGSDDPRLITLGFRLGEQVPDDALFRHVTLPDGWSVQPGEDSRQSYVVDRRGIRRVSVFYKAAFYDRKADMHVLDVGRHLATEAVYGDEPVTGVLHPDLTRHELAALRRAAAAYLEQADPDHPRDRARARRADALLTEIDRRFARLQRQRRRRGGRRERSSGRTQA